MNATRTILAIALATLSLPSYSDDAQPQSAAQSASMPGKSAEWVSYLSDFTRNGDMLADPKKFIAALAAVSEPEFLIEAGKAMMDPNLYLQSTSSLMDPRAYGNFAKAMDPVVLAAWSQALMDPQFISAATTVMTDPNKLMRWMMAPVDPRALGMLLNTLNPNTYLKFAGAALDPRTLNMATAPMNPSWYGGWIGNMANPQAYGPTMGNLLKVPGYGGQMGPPPRSIRKLSPAFRCLIRACLAAWFPCSHVDYFGAPSDQGDGDFLPSRNFFANAAFFCPESADFLALQALSPFSELGFSLTLAEWFPR
jgi:hypothetical protein